MESGYPQNLAWLVPSEALKKAGSAVWMGLFLRQVQRQKGGIWDRPDPMGWLLTGAGLDSRFFRPFAGRTDSIVVLLQFLPAWVV